MKRAHWFATAALAVLVGLSGVQSAAAQDSAPTTYVVKSGDTLYRIALNHGTTVAALQRLNGINTTNIEVGQTLILRADEAAEEAPVEAAEEAPDEDAALFTDVYGATPDPPEPGIEVMRGVEVVLDPVASSDAFDVYRTRRRDTFESVGERLRIPAGVLRALNPDVAEPMRGGTEIRLPIDSSLLLYSVEDGDTVEGVAAGFGTTAAAIMDENGLDTTTLRIGQRLRIPIGQAQASAETATEATTESAGGGAAQNRIDEPEISSTPVVGNVSIYPADAEGVVMTNGKPYEAKRFTVSHATLNLGTVLLLTNEVTGRKTFAEVTDRPSPDADVLLQVSRAVADVLGLGKDGGKVTVQVAG